MTLSLEAIAVFAAAAELGSFSAAARQLGKSQSTVSEAIAKLEIDLGTPLFDRGRRQPNLTEAGARLLDYAHRVLASHDELRLEATRIAAGQEPRLTLVISESYQSERLRTVLLEMERRFPSLVFECLFGEHEDVISLLQSGRAHLGLIPAMSSYPADIGHRAVDGMVELAVFAARDHPLAVMAAVDRGTLLNWRELRLDTYVANGEAAAPGATLRWSAPSYWMLLEMALLGVGWAELPRWLAREFGGGQLQELPIAGGPRRIPLEVVWSRRQPLGQAALWFMGEMTPAPR
ncbi:MAG: LysR family transcriptional regulator [Burkholderiaceae bacterium]